MSALSRRKFLQSSAAVAGAAAVAGSAGRATAAERSGTNVSPLGSRASRTATSGSDGGDASGSSSGPIIAYVDGATVTVLRGEREVTRTDAELARRIARAAGKEA